MSASGNNLKLASDLTRRTLMINLAARCESPELRRFDKTFVAICNEDRLHIVKSILTILKAWHVAGKPEVGHTRLGTFEQWSDEIGAPIMWLGMPDPALGQARAIADEGISAWGRITANLAL
jgi:putative DNA primase/helicase